MPKISNVFLKDSELMTSHGRVKFNGEGIAEVSDQETIDLLLSIANYHLVEEEQPKEEPKEEEQPKEEPKEEPKKEVAEETPKKKATK